MNKLTLAGIFLVAIGAGAASADVTGRWKTHSANNGGYLHVTIAPCGSAYCGKIEQAYDRSGKPVAGYEHAGKKMIWDMKPEGGNGFSGGKIWTPVTGKTYHASMALKGDKLQVKGCLKVGKLCQKFKWRRVK